MLYQQYHVTHRLLEQTWLLFGFNRVVMANPHSKLQRLLRDSQISSLEPQASILWIINPGTFSQENTYLLKKVQIFLSPGDR